MNTDELPPGWASAALSQVCDKIQDGTHFSPKEQFAEGAFRYITAKNVKPAGLDLSDVTYLSEQDHRDIYQRCDPKYGDVLLVKDGVNTGDVSINTIAEEISLLSSVCMLRPKPDALDNRYLCRYLQSPIGKNYLLGKMTGTAIKRVILKKIKDSPVLLAPLQEQRRIVARIDELFAELDEAVAELKRVRSNLKRYRASVLKAAVSGDLTADWRATHPNTEPASALLERILTDRRAKWEADQLAKFAADNKTPPKDWQAKYTEPSKPDTSKLPPLPEGWCWATVEQCAVVVRGASPRPAGDARFFSLEQGTPWITVGSLTSDERMYLDAVGDFLTPEGKDASRYIEAGTLLLTNSGATLGVPKIIRIGGCINDGSVALLYLDGVLQHFIYYLFRSLTKRLRAINQGAAQPNLNTGIVKAIWVPLPPLAEQEAIVLEVEARLSDVSAAEAAVSANLTRAARLRQSILKEAFAGRLVPQDPADEPASALLERIRTAKPTATPAKKPRGRKGETPTEVNEAIVEVLAFAVPTATEAGSLNRTKIQKFAAVLQTHHGVEIVARFLQAPFGPYAPELEDMELICGERRFFTVQKQPKGEDGFEVAYVPGENAEVGRAAGVKRLGKHAADAEKLLRLIRSMTTDAAELFATVYAVWNDLLLDGKPVDDAAIVAGVYGWNVKKKKFTPAAITAMIARIRLEGYEPTGHGKRTEPPGHRKATRKRRG